MTFTFHPIQITNGKPTKFYILSENLSGIIDDSLKLTGWRTITPFRMLDIHELDDLKNFLTKDEYLQFQREIFDNLI